MAAITFAHDTEFLTRLMRHEGFRGEPYRDTVGKLTIGYGRNLDDVGITREEALYLLQNDIRKAEALLNNNAPWWRNMNEARQRVLLDMCFNMGWGNGKRGLSSFVNTLGAMRDERYRDAATGMRRSKWAEQVGQRAEFLARVMETGEWA